MKSSAITSTIVTDKNDFNDRLWTILNGGEMVNEISLLNV